MSGKYVPPSRRAGFKPTTSELPPGHISRAPGHRIHNVELVFDTRQQGTFNYFAWHLPGLIHSYGRAIKDLRLSYDPTRTPETTPLPPSPPPPLPPHPLGHLVAYIMIFGNAHPLWESHGELWSHTDAHILIEDEQALRQNFDRPIPVFASKNRDDRTAHFEGWWMLDKLRVVPPEAEEEIKDLHITKQQAKGPHNTWLRTASAWSQSMRCTWIKTRWIRVDTSDPRYTNLPDPFNLASGEGARLVLTLGGMEEELAILENEALPLKDDLVARHQRRPTRAGRLDS